MSQLSAVLSQLAAFAWQLADVVSHTAAVSQLADVVLHTAAHELWQSAVELHIVVVMQS